MEFNSADFMKLTINDVSDLLLNDLAENGKDRTGALLLGKDNDDRPYKLSVILEVMSDGEE